MGEKGNTWEQVRKQVTKGLLTADERAHLKKEIMAMTQRRDETVGTYCARFRAAVKRAWTLEKVIEGTDAFDMVLSHFLVSLSHDTTAFHINIGHPKSMEEAFALAEEAGIAIERREDRERVGVAPGEYIGAASGGEERKEDSSDRQHLKTMRGEIKAMKKIMLEMQTQLAEKGREKPEQGTQRGSGYAYTKGLGGYKNNHTRDAQGRSQKFGGQNSWGNNNWGRDNSNGGQNRNGPAGNDVNLAMKCFGCGGPHPVRRCPRGAGAVQGNKGATIAQVSGN